MLGGARSGKSRYAEALGQDVSGSRTYIATAAAGDEEMTARIAEHRVRRGPNWTTIEEPVHLAAALDRAMAPSGFVLVDCITLWLSNLLLADQSPDKPVEELLCVLAEPRGTVVLVSNEVGLGIVPENALARRFRDLAGTTNQRLAAAVDSVVFLAAGLPIVLKPSSS